MTVARPAIIDWFMKIGVAIALATSLGSCSSVYDITAKIVDGQVAFFADTDFFGNPDCIRSIAVEAVDGPPATASSGDDEASVQRGVYWQKTFASPSCENPFPVRYGAELTGPPFIYADGKAKSVEPKPLLRGVTYNVSAESSGSAYGGGRFRIEDNGKIQNLPL